MTGIRSFDSFVGEARLTKFISLSALSGKSIGISVSQFVSQVLSTLPTHREPLLHATGGAPLTLELAIIELKKQFDKHNIDAIFVFDGLCLVQTARHPSYEEASWAKGTRGATVHQLREHAWTLYNKGQGEQAVVVFDEAETFNLRNDYAMRAVIRLLLKHKLDYMVAPYTASAQLAYLYRENYIDAVYACSDILLFDGVSSLILSLNNVVDATNTTNATNSPNTESNKNDKQLPWISKSQLLEELGMVSHEQFVEMALACGCDLTGLITFPVIETSIMATGLNALRLAQNLVQNEPSGSLFNMILATPDQSDIGTPYAVIFQRALASVLFQPVLKDSGKVGAIDHSDRVPSDMHEFIGQRLPDELYFYMSRGLIGPEMLDALTSGMLYEYAPLDGGSSTQYQDYIKNSQQQQARGWIFSYLVQALHRYFQFKNLECVTWFDQSIPIPKINPPLYKSIGISWRLTEDQLKEAKVSVPATVGQALVALASNAGNSVFSSEVAAGSIKFASITDITVNIYYRVLQTLGFVDDSHRATAWGRAVADTLSKQDAGSSDFEEQLLVVACLLQQNKERDIIGVGKPNSNNKPSDYIRLISRVATHISLKHKPIGYTGPLNRELLNYQCFVAAETKILRELTEAVTVSLFLNGNTNRTSWNELPKWNELFERIPFTSAPNTGTGIAVKLYLEEVESKSGNGGQKEAVETIKTMFSQASNVRKDMQTAFKFWDAFVALVSSAGVDLGVGVKEYVKEADTWLKAQKSVL